MTWKTVRNASMKLSKFCRAASPSLRNMYLPPKSYIPSRAKINMNKKSRIVMYMNYSIVAERT